MSKYEISRKLAIIIIDLLIPTIEHYEDLFYEDIQNILFLLETSFKFNINDIIFLHQILELQLTKTFNNISFSIKPKGSYIANFTYKLIYTSNLLPKKATIEEYIRYLKILDYRKIVEEVIKKLKTIPTKIQSTISYKELHYFSPLLETLYKHQQTDICYGFREKVWHFDLKNIELLKKSYKIAPHFRAIRLNKNAYLFLVELFSKINKLFNAETSEVKI